MNKEYWKLYLIDLIALLKEDALTAVEKRKDNDFQAGRSLAYYEVFSTIVNQLMAFNLDPAEVGLESFNPDKELA